MHERNIYKVPHNFSELAKKHDFLAPFLTLNPKGIPKINFKDPNGLRALTRALLLEDFKLNVEIPDDALIPTVPLRLNYILWIEDLLEYNNGFGKTGTQISGLDVGTGATSIYALLGSKKNQWKMYGSEVDPASVMVARSNVKRNGLEGLVEIKHVKNDTVLAEVLSSLPETVEFTVCNPPFFGDEEEADSLQKSRTNERPEPSGAKSGTSGELIVSGGEYDFVSRMILESKNISDRVRFFSTMIGIKKHVKELVTKLKAERITNFATTEFIQGKTMRWGLAWSFDPKVNLQATSHVTHTFPAIPGCLNFESYILSHLQKLNFKVLETISSSAALENGQSLQFTATENTWTGQRRKRREQERLKKLEKDANPQDGGEPPKKLARMEASEAIAMDCDTSTNQVQPSAGEDVLLSGQIVISREGSNGTVSMRLLEGSLGKDGLNQIMTFLKNSFNRDLNNSSTELYQLTKC